MTMISFSDACSHSATEFYLLRERAENQYLFDRAVEWMDRMRFRADIKLGIARNKDGVVSRFANYDWSQQYKDHPNSVFFDFFRPFLLNKYSRLLRGLDQ